MEPLTICLYLYAKYTILLCQNHPWAVIICLVIALGVARAGRLQLVLFDPNILSCKWRIVFSSQNKKYSCLPGFVLYYHLNYSCGGIFSQLIVQFHFRHFMLVEYFFWYSSKSAKSVHSLELFKFGKSRGGARICSISNWRGWCLGKWYCV